MHAPYQQLKPLKRTCQPAQRASNRPTQSPFVDSPGLDLRDFGHFSASARGASYRKYLGYVEVPVNAELIPLLAQTFWKFGTTPAQTSHAPGNDQRWLSLIATYDAEPCSRFCVLGQISRAPALLCGRPLAFLPAALQINFSFFLFFSASRPVSLADKPSLKPPERHRPPPRLPVPRRRPLSRQTQQPRIRTNPRICSLQPFNDPKSQIDRPWNRTPAIILANCFFARFPMAHRFGLMECLSGMRPCC